MPQRQATSGTATTPPSNLLVSADLPLVGRSIAPPASGPGRAGAVWDGWDTIDSGAVVFSGSVFAGLATSIGPALAYGWA